MPEITRICSATADALWTPLSDVESWPLLLPTVTAVRRLDDRFDFAEGARYLVSQPRLRTAEYVVTRVDPGRSFTWVSQTPGITTTAHHRLRPGRHTCLLHLDIDWTGRLAWVARMLYSGLARRYMELEAAAVEDATLRTATARRPSVPVRDHSTPVEISDRPSEASIHRLRPVFGTPEGGARGHQ